MLYIITSPPKRTNIQFYNLNFHKWLADPDSVNDILDLSQPQVVTGFRKEVIKISTKDTNYVPESTQPSIHNKIQQLKTDKEDKHEIIINPKQNTSIRKSRSKVYLHSTREGHNNHEYHSQHNKDKLKSRKNNNKKPRLNNQTRHSKAADEYDIETQIPKETKVVTLNNAMTISQISELLQIVETEIIKTLFLKGICVTINQIIDSVTAKSLAEHYGFMVLEEKNQIQKPIAERKHITVPESGNIKHKKSIVTILGHTGHGKTTLINKICNQDNNNIGLEQVANHTDVGQFKLTDLNSHEKFEGVILNPPSHRAFSNIRKRYLSIADISIIVIAADEDIQELTIEAIKNCQYYQIPFLIVLTKIDQSKADTSKIKQELVNQNIVLQEWGGNIILIEVNLLDTKSIQPLQYSVCKLLKKYKKEVSYIGHASGRILDIHLDKYTGYVVTVVIESGKLQTGSYILINNSISKIRTIRDLKNKKIDQAEPSAIIQLWGVNSTSLTDSNFITNTDEKLLKKLASTNKKTLNPGYIKINSSVRYSMDILNNKQINLILKADTLSIIEAITQQINYLSQKKVALHLLTCGIGSITATDVQLATISKAQILGFNTTLNIKIKQLADQKQIKIHVFNNLEVLNTYIQTCMLEMVEIEYTEEVLGQAIVENVFVLSKGAVAGCFVKSGKLLQSSLIKVYRDDQIIYQGHLDSLKQVKEDVKEVYADQECGVLSESFDLWQKNDEIRSYKLIPKTKTL